ncbi:MAG TPA: DNA replication/repair protein RecF [Armatimonadota bacterium]|nr:DNA replication/repair protein RecF [Armatimonadota bacterium]
MELQSLQLEHFRSYPSLNLQLGPGMHVFAGANAQGKTNLLEAVYFAATGHSPRTNQESDMIAWDADIARVTGNYMSEIRGSFTVEASLGRKVSADGTRTGGVQKRIKVNGTPRQIADLSGLIPIVLFLVDDLEIIRGEPARRRSFLDTDLAAMSRTYGWVLRQYTRVLDQRNRLLKIIRDGEASIDDLLPWNDQMASFGGRLLEVRKRFVDDLNSVSVSVYQGLTNSPQGMTIGYRREWGDPDIPLATRDEFAAQLAQALDATMTEEVRRGSSLVGPHRDDLSIHIDGKDVRQYGSQGEQRTAALALRVAEFTLLHQLIGEPPVLLLDDILSELDRTRRAALLDHLAPVAQVIVTTTDVDAVGLPPHTHVQLYRVTQGMVEPLGPAPTETP